MSSPVPKSPEQSEKSRKYDRQLRLWGDHGQRLLENSKVCLINATALGTEILKSLILPGVGSFTIVDGEKVTEEDIGCNFFLEYESVGLPRAQIATQCLLELNPDVRGDYIDETAEHILSNTQNFFKNFTLVVATGVSEKVLVTLSKHLWECNVPLLVCRSIGFLGYVRLQIKEHTIIEAHPDSESPDLRLDIPWPALQEYLDGVNIEQLDQKEKNHVPPPVILRYYLNKYKESHEGKLPEKRVEKEALKQMIRDSGNSEEGKQRFVLDENFEQAIHYANSCVTTRAVPDHVQVILDDDCCTNLTQSSSSFWIMCAALREMVEAEGALPVRGTLPDMAADTNSYVTLQNIYQKRAQQQVEVIYRRASQIARNLGLSQETITESEVKYFCKHSSELHLIRGTCIADEYQKTNLDLTAYLEDPDSLIFYYVVLRGLERFIGEFNAYPGQFEDQVEPDILKLKGVIGKLLSEWGYSHALREERVYEVCRYGTAELHSVSSILGGCAAQEVIKVITNQYKPLNNIFIYDGINCTSASFCL
uniref:NEDD8-activating enzyme E1 regulatory subunit n=1 Tax=Dendroctonus ponderosae TaxID=77166 RepID=A0AAR5P3F2_DENPD